MQNRTIEARSRSAFEEAAGGRSGSGDSAWHAPASSFFSHLQSPEAKLISDEVSSQVRELIDALPEEMRQVMILNSFENLSYDEIGQILRIPIGTVSSRLYSARKLLSAQLKETNIL